MHILDKNIQFNEDKLQFKLNKVTYMGNVVMADGIQPSPVNASSRKTYRLFGDSYVWLDTLHSLYESSMTAPLRVLLKKEVQWYWGPESRR